MPAQIPALLIGGAADARLHPLERGFHYGDGLFETLAVRDGHPCRWRAHMDRLASGCERLAIPLPSPEQLRDEALALCAGRNRAVLKIIVSRGIGGRGYGAAPEQGPTRWLGCFDWPVQLPDWHRDGLDLIYCETTLGINPALAGIKHLNRLEQVLGAQEVRRRGADEGLMRDLDGRVVEATAANLVADIDGVLVTPPVDRCGVAGTVRRSLLEQRCDGEPVVNVAPLLPDDLARARSLFLCNAVSGIVAVRRLEGRSFTVPDELPPPLAAAAADAYRP